MYPQFCVHQWFAALCCGVASQRVDVPELVVVHLGCLQCLADTGNRAAASTHAQSLHGQQGIIRAASFQK